MIVKTLILKDEILALEERKAKLRFEVEALEKDLAEKSQSLTEMHKKISVLEPDYKEIERERLIEVDGYMSRSVALRESIDEDEKRLSGARLEQSRITESVGRVKESLKKTTEQLVAFNAEKDKVSGELKTAKQELEDVEKEKGAVSAKLDREIKQAREVLRLVENETDHRKKEIEREERILGLKKRDMDIYASRMHKKYPSENFTLMDVPLRI